MADAVDFQAQVDALAKQIRDAGGVVNAENLNRMMLGQAVESRERDPDRSVAAAIERGDGPPNSVHVRPAPNRNGRLPARSDYADPPDEVVPTSDQTGPRAARPAVPDSPPQARTPEQARRDANVAAAEAAAPSARSLLLPILAAGALIPGGALAESRIAPALSGAVNAARRSAIMQTDSAAASAARGGSSAAPAGSAQPSAAAPPASSAPAAPASPISSRIDALVREATTANRLARVRQGMETPPPPGTAYRLNPRLSVGDALNALRRANQPPPGTTAPGARIAPRVPAEPL